MSETTTLTLDDQLTELINGSISLRSRLSDEKIQKVLEKALSLADDQKTELVALLQEEKEELQPLQGEVQKANIASINEYVNKINELYTEAKHDLLIDAENLEKTTEEQKEEDLIQKLNEMD